MVIGAVGPNFLQFSVSSGAQTLKGFSIDTGLGAEQPAKIAAAKIAILF
jgi:hypothetical protein